MTVSPTPRPVLEAQLKAWDTVIANLSKENAMFAKIIESQKAWAKRTVGFLRLNEPPRDLAYDHFFKA